MRQPGLMVGWLVTFAPFRIRGWLGWNLQQWIQYCDLPMDPIPDATPASKIGRHLRSAIPPSGNALSALASVWFQAPAYHHQQFHNPYFEKVKIWSWNL